VRFRTFPAAPPTDPSPQPATPFVVGGHPATRQHAAVSVQHLTNSSHFCGGSLITSQWVLTATHCTVLIAPGQAQIRSGSLTHSAGGDLTGITHVVAHPDFTGVIGGGDLALVRLDQRVAARPMPIARNAGPPGTSTLIAGWGRVCQDPTNPACAGPVEHLQQLATRLLPDPACNDPGEDTTVESFFATVTDRWPTGREDYHWHILPEEQETRSALYGPYRELTHHVGLVPVTPAWYHVTVLHSAPVEQVSAAELERIVAGVRQRCLTVAGFDLTVDRPGVGGVAVECPARPGSPARRLWEVTAEATAAVIGDRVPVILAVYYPHLSLAYAVAHVDHRPMKVWLSDHDIAPLTVAVRKIALVAQSHDGQQITWRHILDVPLLG
jgi:hypothetical protein